MTSPTLYIQTSETDLQLLLTIAQLKNDLQTANRQKKAADSTAAESERKSKEFQKDSEATAQMRKAEENAKLFGASQKKGHARKNRYWRATYRLTTVPDLGARVSRDETS